MSPSTRRQRAKRPHVALEILDAKAVSPTRVVQPKAIQSPDEGALLSPGFTLCSPAGGLPPATTTLVSAKFDSTLFDMNSNLVNQVHSDLLRTFQIGSISKGIVPALLTSKANRDGNLATPAILSATKATILHLPESSQKTATSVQKAATPAPFASPGIPMKPRKNAKKATDSPAIQCKCLKSKCLKLYCDCLASSKYCRMNCKCDDCMNTNEFEHVSSLLILLCLISYVKH